MSPSMHVPVSGLACFGALPPSAVRQLASPLGSLTPATRFCRNAGSGPVHIRNVPTVGVVPAVKRMPAVRAAESTEVEGAPAQPPPPSFAKGNIVRVNREKYISSVEFKAVDHPPYFKGLDYIYEARGEILDVRSFSSGDYALISWVGISTAPAWLPTYMLDKAPKLEYKRV